MKPRILTSAAVAAVLAVSLAACQQNEAEEGTAADTAATVPADTMATTPPPADTMATTPPATTTPADPTMTTPPADGTTPPPTTETPPATTP